MSHNHSHSHSAAGRHTGRLTIVFALTLVYLVVEVVGGWLTNSLPLFADAGHMFTDAAGVGLALLAIRFARRPATPARTFGYYRAEILAAAINAVVLLGVSLFVLYEGVQRLRHPPEVESGVMLAVASVGLVVNAISVWLLWGGSGESLNMKGAFYEVLSDALTSLGVFAAAGLCGRRAGTPRTRSSRRASGCSFCRGPGRLLSDAVAVLMEGTPAGVELTEVRAAIQASKAFPESTICTPGR